MSCRTSRSQRYDMSAVLFKGTAIGDGLIQQCVGHRLACQKQVSLPNATIELRPIGLLDVVRFRLSALKGE